MPFSLEIARHIVGEMSSDSPCSVSQFARLVRISACYNFYSRVYVYPPESGFNPSDVHQTLMTMHKSMFNSWGQCSIAQQLSDISILFAGTDGNIQQLAAWWLEPDLAQCLVPTSVGEIERHLFLSNLKVVVAFQRLSKSTNRKVEPISIDRRVLQALECLRECPRGVTLKSMAQRLRISQRYLGQMFLSAVGLTFHQYLRILRLKRASELLRDSHISIKVLAAEIGYTDCSNFCHEFRACFHCSPREYRLAERLATSEDLRAVEWEVASPAALAVF